MVIGQSVAETVNTIDSHTKCGDDYQRGFGRRILPIIWIVLRIFSPRLPIPGILFFAGLAASAGLVRADVIYSNFGVGDAYAEGAGVLVTADGVAWSSVALAFTPSENYTLRSVEFVATDLIPGDADPITLDIFADNGAGQPSLTPLESFTVGPLGAFGNAGTVITVDSVLQPLLLANTQYWIGLNAAPGDLIVWNQNPTGASGFSETDGFGNWSISDPLQPQGVVEIDGTVANVIANNSLPEGSVPEPGVFGLMAAGLAAMACLKATRALHPPEITIP